MFRFDLTDIMVYFTDIIRFDLNSLSTYSLTDLVKRALHRVFGLVGFFIMMKGEHLLRVDLLSIVKFIFVDDNFYLFFCFL